MVRVYNPALHEEPLNQRPEAIPLRPEDSIIHWLEDHGRFMVGTWQEIQPHHDYGEEDEELHHEFEETEANEFEEDNLMLEE
jgi:hypothetical protein